MKSILFVDPVAFCTTLATLADPSLRRRPVAIAPLGADRALLIALSVEARAAGLERGIAVSLARRICPDLIVLPPEPRRWARAHRALHEILAQVAPVIEPKRWGHAYLDVTGTERLFGSPIDIAHRLEHEIQQRIGLPIAVGIAVNKLVSESAATVVKREAGAEIWPVAAGHEARFLAPEAITLLPDATDRVRERLHDYHLERIGEVAALGEQSLRVAFGRVGRTLHQHASGIDHRPVLTPEAKIECRAAHVLATDTNDRDILDRLLRTMCERLGRRLRERGYAAGRLVLRVRHSDDTTVRGSIRLAACTLDIELWCAACRTLDRVLTRRIAVRSIELVADELHDGHGQLELWACPARHAAPEAAALQQAVDRVRNVLHHGPTRHVPPHTHPLTAPSNRPRWRAPRSAPQMRVPGRSESGSSGCTAPPSTPSRP